LILTFVSLKEHLLSRCPGADYGIDCWSVSVSVLRTNLRPLQVYISRLEFLSDYVKPDALELPEFVLEHDRELEGRPLMDYGVEADSDQAAMLRSATETVPELREPLGVNHGAG
jgi:hypothetical protein